MAILPPIPSLRPLIWLNVGLAILSALGLFLPIKLAISLRGLMVSDGPTTVITAPNDGVVQEVPREGIVYTKAATLFRFQQPLLQEDLQARRREVADLKQRLAESQSACRRSLGDLENRLNEAQEMDRLNTEAYAKQAISRLQLFQYRSSVSAAVRDLDETRTRCRQEQSQLHSDGMAAEDRLSRGQVSQQFLSNLTAPDEGTVYAITAKPGQRIQAGQELARFVSSSRSIAELRLVSSDRPFVHVGHAFDVTSPTYAFMPSQPVRRCLAETITPDLVRPSDPGSAMGAEAYLLRCRFREPAAQGAYPLLIGMDLVARTAGTDVSLFQLMLKGYRASIFTAA